MDGETRIDSVLFSTWKSNLETVSNVNHRATVMKPIRKRIRQRPLSSTAVSHGRRYVNDATRCQTNCCQKPRRVAAAFGHGTFLETESFFDHHSTEANLDEERRSHANRQCDSRQSMESGAIERRHCDRRAASRETRDARRETRDAGVPYDRYHRLEEDVSSGTRGSSSLATFFDIAHPTLLTSGYWPATLDGTPGSTSFKTG